MMKQHEQRNRWVVTAAALCCLICSGFTGGVAFAASDGIGDFDHQGQKLFNAYNTVPEPYMAADSGGRNLAGFYELRQYPGSPPRIPHKTDLTVGGTASDCLACHGKGGYSAEFGKFAPVTPHPENVLCYQCHTQKVTEEPFVATTWQSISTPRLGRSFLGGSPPPVPHSLQLRENCIACHTGPGAVAEIRIEHSSRGNCRQCHVPANQQETFREFIRK